MYSFQAVCLATLQRNINFNILISVYHLCSTGEWVVLLDTLLQYCTHQSGRDDNE
jgi:hypothetical protein